MSDDTAIPSSDPADQPDAAPSSDPAATESAPPALDPHELQDRVDLDALTAELDRIDAALPRLDDGTYFDDDPLPDDPPADDASPHGRSDATDDRPTGDAAG